MSTTVKHHATIPKSIYIPDYLSKYLSRVKLPESIDMSFLLTLGVDVLEAKIRYT